MREILFRGKRVIGEGWVEGFYHENFLGAIISNSSDNYIVDYRTVGQYTGLTDKNGVKIFEGDIIKDVGSNLVCSVEFDHFGFVRKTCENFYLYTINEKNYEVIGNIHDHPELLEEAT